VKALYNFNLGTWWAEVPKPTKLPPTAAPRREAQAITASNG
jgi:hypothetical protein